MIATIIKTDGQIHQHFSEPSLHQLRNWINCTRVEHLVIQWIIGSDNSEDYFIPHSRSMWVDEDGRSKKLPLNYLATLVYNHGHITHKLIPGYNIVGTAVLYDKLVTPA